MFSHLIPIVFIDLMKNLKLFTFFMVVKTFFRWISPAWQTESSNFYILYTLITKHFHLDSIVYGIQAIGYLHTYTFFLRITVACEAQKPNNPLYLFYFSLILILILRNFFIYTSFWKSLLTRFVFYESRHAVSAAMQMHYLPYSHYFHSSNFFFTKL